MDAWGTWVCIFQKKKMKGSFGNLLYGDLAPLIFISNLKFL